MFDSNCKKGHRKQKVIAYHHCKIKAGVQITIDYDVEGKTVRFSVDGKEQFVSTRSKQKLDFCYGFFHLRCDHSNSEIEVKLTSALNDEGTNSFVLLAVAN